MLSLASAEDTTWSSVDIMSACLNGDIHDEDTVLVRTTAHVGQDEHSSRIPFAMSRRPRVFGKENVIRWQKGSPGASDTTF